MERKSCSSTKMTGSTSAGIASIKELAFRHGNTTINSWSEVLCTIEREMLEWQLEVLSALTKSRKKESDTNKNRISHIEACPCQASRAHAHFELLNSKRLANSHKRVQRPFKSQSLLPRPQKVEHFHEPGHIRPGAFAVTIQLLHPCFNSQHASLKVIYRIFDLL